MHDCNVSEYSYGMWLTAHQTYRKALHKRPNARIRVGHYHTLPSPKGNLYQAVRKILNISRANMAKHIGISEESLRYRERTKRVYHLCEMVALLQVSGLTPEDFMQLVNDIA